MKKRLEYFIYAVYVDAPDRTLVKIGRAASVRERVSQIQVGCPYPIREVYSCDVLDEYEGGMREAQMHEIHADHRLKGEWFDPWQRVADDDDIRRFEADMKEVAGHRLPGPVRCVKHVPTRGETGSVRMRRVPLDDAPEPVIRDEDGYPIAAPYIEGRGNYPVSVVVKPRRRLFRTC